MGRPEIGNEWRESIRDITKKDTTKKDITKKKNNKNRINRQANHRDPIAYLTLINSINKNNKPPRKIFLPKTHFRNMSNHKSTVTTTEFKVICASEGETAEIVEGEFGACS